MNTLYAITILSVYLLVNKCDGKEYFTPCRASDPDLDKCVKAASKEVFPLLIKGVPELNLEPFDPFDVEDIHVTDLPGIKFHLTNVTIEGTRNAKINRLKLDTEKKQISLKYFTPSIMYSDYEVDGRVLILVLNGKGKAKFTMDMNIEINMDYDIKEKNGKKYWKIIKHRDNFVPSNIDFELTNLFSGNPQLENFGTTFLKQNALEIYKEIGAPVVSKVSKKIVKKLGKFFAAFPAEQILLP